MATFYAMIHRIAFWFLLAICSSFVIRFILLMDPNKRVYNHTPGPCRVLRENLNGVAGMHLVPSIRRVYITFGFAKGFNDTDKTITSGIVYYDIKELQQGSQQQQQQMYELREMTIDWNTAKSEESTFAPAGIASYASKGRLHLYIVNSHPKRQCIHFFTADKEVLKHRKMICNPMFTSIQDITVVGPDRFYITNLAYFGRGAMQNLELAAQSSFGTLFFFDGRNVNVALQRLPSPMPVEFDSFRSILYIGSVLNEVIQVYDVKKDMSLTHKLDISLLTSPVSLHVDSKTGDIWAACHPVMFQAFLHYQNVGDKNVRSPSQVLRIRIQEDGVSWVITEPYANDGATIATSRSVAYLDEQLLIGGAFGRLLHCDVLNPQIT